HDAAGRFRRSGGRVLSGAARLPARSDRGAAVRIEHFVMVAWRAPAGRGESHAMRTQLREIAVLFLRLGATAFGGPAAHVALMERAVVRDRRWVDHEEFADLLGAASLLPGPTSTELAIFLGLRRGGPVGLAVAGASFILPSALLTLALAWGYARFGTLPA